MYVRYSRVLGCCFLVGAFFTCITVGRCEPPGTDKGSSAEVGKRAQPAEAPRAPAIDAKTLTKSERERIDRLIRQLSSDSFQERVQASNELVSIGAPAMEPLQSALKAADPEVVRRANDCVAQIERNLRIASLIKLLGSKSDDTRLKAAEELWELGPPAKDAVPVLLKLILQDSDSRVRSMAASVLAKLGAESKPTVPKLLEVLDDKNSSEELQENAIFILGHINQAADEAVPRLLRLLETGRESIKGEAANALGKIGKNHEKVVPALIRTLSDPNGFLASNAAAALGQLGRDPEEFVPALITLLKRHRGNTRSDDPRGAALWYLGKFAREAKAAIPLILEIVKDEKEKMGMRRRAIRALGDFGATAKEAIPTLRALLKNPYLGDEAAEVLESIIRPE